MSGIATMALEEVLRLHRGVSDPAGVLEALASLSRKQENLERAARLLGAAEAVREHLGLERSTAALRDFETERDSLVEGLSAARYDHLFGQGSELAGGASPPTQ